jgi:hypothetical protein
MVWSMVWAGTTAWLSAIVMCFTAVNWVVYMEATPPYLVKHFPQIPQETNLRNCSGMFHGRNTLRLWRRNFLRDPYDGFECTN